MAWKLFAKLNGLFWMAGLWQMLREGHFPGAIMIAGTVISGVAAIGLYAYAHELRLGFPRRFWTVYCSLFLLWSLFSVVWMASGSRALLQRPGGAIGVFIAVLTVLAYSYFQAVALYRQRDMAPL
jgi:bacteriorhodopsin